MSSDTEIPVGDAARVLAAAMDVEATAGTVTDQIMEEVWPQRDSATFREAVMVSTTENIAAILAIMSGWGRTDVQPEGALAFAEVTARLGVPIGEVDKAYRVGTTALWNMWFDIAREHADGGPIDELISGPTRTIHAYVNQILDAVAERHRVIRGEMRRTSRDLRMSTLTELLDGGEGDADLDADRLEHVLDYRVDDEHLAVLVETPDTAPPDAFVAEVRSTIDVRATLEFPIGPRSWVVWFGRSCGFDSLTQSRLRRVLANTGLPVAISEPARGIPGLRRTYRQAVDTGRIQRAFGLAGHRCLLAREVRLETLMLADEARARDFIADELGPLGDHDAQTARLRETVLAWLATGSHVSAAAVLGVHENTVRNRIRAAEELIGSSLPARRTELQVALRLERVLRAEHDERLVVAA